MRRKELRYKLAKAAEKSSGTQEWTPIPNHPSYLISRRGEIKSLKRKQARVLRPIGDWVVIDNTHCKVSPYVAEQYVPNPSNLPFVAHIDMDKRNNKSSNLEWRLKPERSRRAHKCPVLQYTIDGELIGKYGSIMEASLCTHVSTTAISNVCRGFRPSSCGFVWKYAS